ncbi:ABC transporter substrate-binding protein [Maridesulfovibrio sp.]|uniref:ABC transporter substrate-binding protein n=1 Tax=Maridesulfovibrio sp. TaxID=2795000 RepID=UPI002A18CF94|nr:ABC transporter substrate-binding protein [Maridesulfovibrio sp.]
MPSNTSRKGASIRITAAVSVLLQIMFFVQCATASATEITFWTTEVNPERQAVIEYLVRAFRINHPDIAVNVRGVEENKIAAELARAREAGSGPDMIGCASDLIVSFDSRGWTNFAETGRVISGIGRNNFYPGALNKLRLANGRFCGIPFNGWVQGIWYRKDWFEEKGLAPPDTWDNILKAARAFHDPENGRYGILVGTRADSYAEQIFTHLALSAGGREFSKNGKVVFDSPEIIKTARFYKELAKYTPPGPQWWRGRDFYMQGKLAMMFYSTFIMDDFAIESVAADSLGGKNFPDLNGTSFDVNLLENTCVVPVITGTRKAGFGVVHALGLLDTGSRERQEATGCFVNFLFREDAYITWLHMVPGGMLPVLKSVTRNPAFYRDAQGVFHKYSRQRIEKVISGFDSLKSFSFADGVLLSKAAQASALGIVPAMIDKIVNRGVPAEQAVHEAAAELETIEEDLPEKP